MVTLINTLKRVYQITTLMHVSAFQVLNFAVIAHLKELFLKFFTIVNMDFLDKRKRVRYMNLMMIFT